MTPEELGLEPIKVTPLLYNYLIKQQILNFRPNLPAEISAPAVYSFYLSKSFLDSDIFVNNCHFMGIFFGIDDAGALAIILKRVKIIDPQAQDPNFEDLDAAYYLGSSANNFSWTSIARANTKIFTDKFLNTFYPNANRDYKTNKSVLNSNTYVRCGYYIGDECLKKALKKGGGFWAGLQVHIGINTLYDAKAVYNLQLIMNGVDVPNSGAYQKISQGPSFKKMWVTEPASPTFELEGKITLPPLSPSIDLGLYRTQYRQRIAVEIDPNKSK